MSKGPEQLRQEKSIDFKRESEKFQNFIIETEKEIHDLKEKFTGPNDEGEFINAKNILLEDKIKNNPQYFYNKNGEFNILMYKQIKNNLILARDIAKLGNLYNGAEVIEWNRKGNHTFTLATHIPGPKFSTQIYEEITPQIAKYLVREEKIYAELGSHEGEQEREGRPKEDAFEKPILGPNINKNWKEPWNE